MAQANSEDPGLRRGCGFLDHMVDSDTSLPASRQAIKDQKSKVLQVVEDISQL